MDKTNFQTFCFWAKALHCQQPLRWLPPLIVMTDQGRLPDIGQVIPRLPYHSIIILRDYHHPDRLALAHQLRRLCRRHGHLFLVSGDPLLAVRVKADGVHVPESKPHLLTPWREKRPHWVITAAAHSPKSLYRVERGGADAIIYSPVFPTRSHPGHLGLGPFKLRQAVQKSSLPVYALGGIQGETIRNLKGSGVCGVAAIDVFVNHLSVW